MTKKQLEESVAYLEKKGFEKPEIGIVLGQKKMRKTENML